VDWKNEAKAARERVAFLVQLNHKFFEQCEGADMLVRELEKYNEFTKDPLPLLDQKNAEIEVIKVYKQIVKEVEKKLA